MDTIRARDMTFKNRLSAIQKVLAIKFLGKKIPIVVTWPITNRCNFQCQYCERWKRKTEELTTKQVFSIIDELKSLGTIRISLSGGEPLMREDIGQIIDYAKSRGISVVLTSNGSLVPQKIEEIKNLDLLKLSIEGREKIHDRIRGKGSFKKVLKAAEIARQSRIKIVFNSVLTALNLNQIDFLLNLAEKHQTGARFTALNIAHAGKDKIEPLFPKRRDYREAVEKLIKAKREGKSVLNSLAGLKYLQSWPTPCHPDSERAQRVEGERSCVRFFGLRSRNDTCFKCFAGRAFAHLSAEGKLYPCVIMEGKIQGGDVLNLGFGKAFENLLTPLHLGGEVKACQENTFEVGERCSGCWCGGTLELNLLLDWKPRSILNLRNLT